VSNSFVTVEKQKHLIYNIVVFIQNGELMKNSKKIIIVLTGLAILAAGILCKQEFFLMIPLFVSLFVMAFQSEANRVGALIGAVNSLIYTATYMYMGVYASAASALLFSFPIQLGTFFSWKKKAYKNTAVFKKMSNKARAVFTLAVLAAGRARCGQSPPARASRPARRAQRLPAQTDRISAGPPHRVR